MSNEKKALLSIRCSLETKARLFYFKNKYGHSNLEDVLKRLLKMAETHPELVEVRWI